MPNCFSLTRKGESEPTSLVTIDEEICAHLGVPVDPVNYVHSWFDVIGFKLALGKTFPQIIEHFTTKPRLEDGSWEEHMLKIAIFLDENFTADAWAEIGGRR